MTRRDAAGEDVVDEFERLEFAEKIAKLLYDYEKQRSTGLVIGLTGPWGSGKSQALHYVKKHLDAHIKSPQKNRSRPLVVVPYNPWLYSERNVVIDGFIRAVERAIVVYSEMHDSLKSASDPFESWREPLTTLLNTIKLGDLTKRGPLESQKDELLRTTKKYNISLVVLIDELDRLGDEEILGMAQAIKALGDLENFSYLVAYDPDRVAKALGRADLKFGHNYLEKIVQVQMRLPRIPEDSMKKYVIGQFSDKSITRKLWDELLNTLVPQIIYTPRDARRFAAAYAARNVVGDEVDKRDLLLYCALESRIPVISERLQNLTARVSVDGSRELNRQPGEQISTDACIQRLLDVFRDDTSLHRLLLDLFPALDGRGSELIARDDNRLCYETSLLTLLNYGSDEKRIVSKAEILKQLNEPGGISRLLELADLRNCVRQANLRLRTVVRDEKLDDQTTRTLLQQVGKFFDRPISKGDMGRWTPWVDVSHVWVRGALQHYFKCDPINKNFVHELIKGGGLHLPAQILYFHFQAHGLYQMEYRSSLKPPLSKLDTIELAEAAVEPFTNFIVANKEWRLRGVVPLWIVKMLSERSWQRIRDFLSNPVDLKSPNETLFGDGVATLLLRTRGEKLLGQALVDMLDVRAIVDFWRKYKSPQDETRKPVEDAYRYLHDVMVEARTSAAASAQPS